MGHSFLSSALIFLTAAIVVVPLTQRLGLGSVLGYLFAGTLIGPWCLGLIRDVNEILHFSEFGVVLLLFLIGLELNPKRLWKLRVPIFGLGGLQVVIGIFLFSLFHKIIGWSWNSSLLAGMGIALSSTAITLQILKEKNLMSLPSGQNSFSVLLFQDLAVIPMMAVVTLLSPNVATLGEPTWIVSLKVLGAILFVVLGGHWLTRPLFRYVAKSGSREILTGFSLLLVIAIASLMQTVGLSMALGTFLAGVILADSEYRYELESDIEPFKGLLLGLFFISVGMSINFGILESEPLTLFLWLIGIVVLKTLSLIFLARLFKMSWGDAFIFAFGLSQIGEFAFVLFNIGMTQNVLTSDQGGRLILITALSMTTTPLLFLIFDKWIAPRLIPKKSNQFDKIEDHNRPVIVAGFGRFGGIVARILMSKKIKATILDHDPNQIDLVRKFGNEAYYGDVARLDLLHSAGAENARLLIMAIDDPETTKHTIEMVKVNFPNLKIMARARGRVEAYDLRRLGVDIVIRETFGSAIDMGREALKYLGLTETEATDVAQRFRLHDEQLFEESWQQSNDQSTLITKVHKARIELEKLLNKEEHNSQTSK